jgi:hypothetical protein
LEWWLWDAAVPHGTLAEQAAPRAWVGEDNSETDWQLPLHQKYISEDIRLRFARLWAECELFYQILEGLPGEPVTETRLLRLAVAVIVIGNWFVLFVQTLVIATVP